MPKSINFNTPIMSDDRMFSYVEAFDDYFFLHGKKYKVITPLGGKDHYVQKEEVKANIPLNIVKVLSYCTGIIPLIMLIGKAIARSHYNFYKQHESWDAMVQKKEEEKDAAVKIQSSFRQFNAKKLLEEKKEEKAQQEIALQTAKKQEEEALQAAKKNEEEIALQAAKKKEEEGKALQETKKQEEAATCIQSHVKGFLAKKAYENKTALLKQAFLDERPAVAAWLIQEKGASLQELEAYAGTTPLTKEKKELLSWLKLVTVEREATAENLDHFALTLGLGYKSANLLVMEQKAELMSKNLKTATVKVPPFLPVGDFEMTQYIQKSIPQVFAKWDKFLDSTFDEATKQAFLDADSNEKASKSGLKITPEGEAILEEIKKEIMDHFKTNHYHSPQMAAWISKIDPQFLIVRSTGKEDSDTNSNAGGNASIPYVKSDEESISIAIGEVIASYFGEKSINQRILCGDRSLFTDEKPFVPILMQEMVGENLGGVGSKNEDIPRSGVLFTRQADKAEGVTFIQTGLGNNEGVVSSQVFVDSYFVKQGKVHAVVREKETRFVSLQGADGKITVEPIKNNNPKLEKSQALPNSIILDIKRVADDISATYANEEGGVKPMDMEYTVKLKEKGSDKPVIYLLQARPLMNTKGEEEIEHTYLDLKELKALPKEKTLSSEILLDGNAYVRKITDSDSVIFADDLPKGADIYLHADNPAAKKVIVLKKTAPATSHESVVLRPKGVAVIVLSDPAQYASLKKLVSEASEDTPLLIDTQRGILASCSSKEAPDQMIKKGLVSYPIPLEVSVPHSHIMQQVHKFSSTNEGVAKILLANFNNEADTLIKELQGDKELLLGVDTRELLDIMATKDENQAKLALATLLKRLKNRLAMSMKETDDFRKNINQPMFQLFEAAIRIAQKEIVPALEQHAAQSLERLYPIKFLDAMIHQKMNPDVMNNPSYHQVLALDVYQKKAMEEAKKTGINYAGPNGTKLISLHLQADGAYNEECRKNWLQLVGDLAKLDNEAAAKFITRISPIVSLVGSLNITDKWLNVQFNEVWKKHSAKDPDIRLEAVIAELEQTSNTNKKTLSWIKERMGTLAIYKQGTPNWTDPTFAKKQAPKLQKAFTGDLGFDKTGLALTSIKAIYDAADEFGKLALLEYIRDAVNTYDCIIKATKESSNFSTDQAKALAVADLLEGYFEMMQATFTLVPKSEQKALMCNYQYWHNQSKSFLETYIGKLENGCEYSFGFDTHHLKSPGFTPLVAKLKANGLDPSEQLEARKQFSVDSMIVGSKADLEFSVHWPERLEEYFTTFHQNMEQIVKVLSTKNGLNTGLLSEKAKELCDLSKTKFKQDISYLNLSDGKLHVGYQIPLRQHAASFIISYDPKHPEQGLDLKVQMFGNDEQKRWDWGATFGAILAYTMANGFAEDTPPQIDYKNPEGVSFTLKIPADFNKGEELINAIRYITKVMTMDKDGNPHTLLKYMQTGETKYAGVGDIDWENLNPECFKYTLHINRILINKLLAEGKNEAVAKVAINSIKGLVHYGIEDYTRIPGKLPLVKKAVDELVNLIPTLPSIHAEIQALIDDPDVKKIPGVCTPLELELAKI